MSKNKKQNKNNNVLLKVIIYLTLIIIVISPNIIHIKYKDLNYKQSIDIKIGDELPSINDYIDNENLKKLDTSEINWGDIDLKDNKIYSAGTYNGYITFRNKQINLKLNVIDDEKPIITGVRDITINVNKNIDLLKNIKVTDNSNDKIEVKVIGEYDIKKVGEYKLSYVACDNSNNETVEEFKLTVKEEIKNNQTSSNETVMVGTTSKGYEIKKVNDMYYINDILIANKTYGLPSSYAPGGLKLIFNNAFDSMKNNASNQGISLKVISGYRSYSRQSSIYNNYVNKDGKTKADTYSARPGHSEHQTGLAADINSLSTSFINTKEGKWLNENCYKYGFIIRYPKGKENITGYMYEPWHIRYVGVKLATALYNNGNWISLEEHLGITSRYNY